MIENTFKNIWKDGVMICVVVVGVEVFTALEAYID